MPVQILLALLVIFLVAMVKSSFQGRIILAVGLVAFLLYSRSSGKRK